MVGGPSASLPDSRAVQGPAGYTTCRLPTALSYAQVHRPKRPVMIAVDWLCAPGAPLIVVTGSGGELLQTALSRLAPGRSLSCYGPLPRTRDARRLRRAGIIRVARGAEGSLPEARP